MRMLLALALLANIPLLQAAAPPTSPVRLTLEQALARVERQSPGPRLKQLRSRLLEAALDLNLARRLHDESRSCVGRAVEARALAITPADRAQALGQGKMFEARALNYVGAVREHQRTLGQLLGVAPGREIFVRVPDAEGPETRRLLWALTPEEALALPRSLRQPLTDWDATVAGTPWAKVVPRLAEWNQCLIDFYESDYQKWAEDYNLLRERLTALKESRDAYEQQLSLRRLEHTQRKGDFSGWLESQRFHLEAEASLKMVQKDLLLKLLRRHDALRR